MTTFRYNIRSYLNHDANKTSKVRFIILITRKTISLKVFCKKFNELLLSTWDLAMTKGYFNYRITLKDRKIRFLEYHGSKIILQVGIFKLLSN
jgi:hypothetical protein